MLFKVKNQRNYNVVLSYLIRICMFHKLIEVKLFYVQIVETTQEHARH